MKNCLFSFFLIILAFLLQCCTTAPKYNVEKIKEGLNIEKGNDAIWYSVKADTLNGQVWGEERRTSLNDFNVIFKSRWDTSNIYFRIEIWDDKKVFNSLVSSGKNDNVLLCFCTKLKKIHKPVKGDIVTFFFNYGDGRPIAASTKGLISEKDNDKGCILQIKIPWRKVGIVPKPNLRIPFNMIASDQDHPEQQPEGYYFGRETAISWAKEFIYSPLETAYAYGDLILRE